jgi:hypothetical protein
MCDRRHTFRKHEATSLERLSREDPRDGRPANGRYGLGSAPAGQP